MQWSRGNRKLRKNHKGASVCSVYASVFIFGFVFTFYCFISFFSISYLPRCHCDDDDGNNEAQQRLCQFHDSDQRFPLCFFSSSVLFANVSVFKFILFPVWRGWCRCYSVCSYCLRTAFFRLFLLLL